MTFGDSVIILFAVLLISGIWTCGPLSPRVRLLLVAGLVLRIIGGQLYLLIGELVYGGSADYWYYFHHGRWYAKALLAGTPEASGSYWLALDIWWGTPFTIRTSGLLSAALDPSIYGSFLAFSLIGYLGVVAFALAFCRAFPALSHYRYLLWLMLFPSLWYWPAALGKDALMIAGIGTAVLGYVGRTARPNWILLAAGSALVFAVRPQVAVVLVAAFGAGHWIAVLRRGTAARLEQGVLMAVLGVGVLLFATRSMNLTFTDASEVGEYLTGTKAATAEAGGSAIEVEDQGGLNPLEGAISVVARPFLWEARSVTALFAAFEILAFWALAWIQRQRIANFIYLYRGHPLFWMATIFVLIYAVGLGMAAGNLGVVARQRIHVFPLVFMFFSGPIAVRRSPRTGEPDVSTKRLGQTVDRHR
jgi:hypothetical protein